MVKEPIKGKKQKKRFEVNEKIDGIAMTLLK